MYYLYQLDIIKKCFQVLSRIFEQALVSEIEEKDVRMSQIIINQYIINFIEFIFFLDKANSI